MKPLEQLLAPWRQVTRRADQFFDVVHARHRPLMQCRPGCADCCRQDLSLMLVEALALAQALERLPEHLRRAVGQPGRAPCALLLEDRCVAYDQRPVLCRTHGLPVRYSDPDRPRAPAEVGWCPLNFTAGDPPADAVLEGTLLLAGLSVADSMARQELGIPDPLRIPISDLARQGARALPLDSRLTAMLGSGR